MEEIIIASIFIGIIGAIAVCTIINFKSLQAAEKYGWKLPNP